MRRVEFTAVLYFVWLAAHAEPFWRTKDKYYQRVKAGEVIVSVGTGVKSGPTRRLTIVGGGRVPAPLPFTYDFSRRLDRVAASSGYVHDARMNAARDRLHLTFKALGRTAEFDVKVRADEPKHKLDFEILGGPLAGLTSTLTFGAVDGGTEVAIDGAYDYQSFPLKGALLTVGMEGIFKTMAERLRDAVVAERKAVDKAAPGVEHSAAPKTEP